MVNADKSESQAETAILLSARKEFEAYGYAGARMQRIADGAGINKALLHYYFRNKNQLFLRIFEKALAQALPQLEDIIREPGSLEMKIRKFVHVYINTLQAHPYLPSFVLAELRHQSTDFFAKTFPPNTQKAIEDMFAMLDMAANAGLIRRWNWGQLLVSMISLCVFPFAASPILSHLLQHSREEQEKFLEERKEFVSDFILAALKTDIR